MSEADGVLHGIAAPERPLGRERRRRPRACSTALVYRSNLLGADRALANLGGGNTSAKETIVDHAGREMRVLWVKGSGTDLATITRAGFAGAAPRRGAAAARTRRDGRRGDGRLPPALRASAPTSRGRRSRRCCTRSSPAAARRPHASRRGHRADLDAERAQPGRGGVRRRGGLARLPAARLRHVAARSPSCSRSNPQARAVLLEKHGLVTWGDTGEESYRATHRVRPRAAEAIDRAATGGFGLGGRKVAPSSARTRRPPSCRRRCPRSAARCSPTPTAWSSRSTAARRRSRSPRSARAPEVSQIGAPCPDHLINTKHRPLVVDFDPETRRRARASGGASRTGVDGVRRTGTAPTTSETSTTRRGRSRSTPPGRASCSSPASASSRAGPDAGRARVARDLYHRAIAVRGRRRRDRRLPVAERDRGVRDRVLAARALQAGPGAAARRARREDRAGHRRRERHRPRDRARARRARRARRRRRPERRRRRRRSPTRSSPRTASGGRSRSRST